MSVLVRAALKAMIGVVAAGGASIAVAQSSAAEESLAPEAAAQFAYAAPGSPPPPSDDIRMRTYLATLRPRALAMGVPARLFDATLPTVEYNPRVVRFDRAQPGVGAGNAAPPPFAPYRDRHVDQVRIGMGRSRYAALRPMLIAVERKTGVPEHIMMAIYGHETGYGTFTGNFDLLNSLATLAFEGRRRTLFEGEFLNALLMIHRGVPRSKLKGSWAGATGYPQFLPSVYLRLGADGDGDGKADIWTSEADALASIGRYLQAAGWKPDVPWGVAVRVPEGIDRAALRSPLKSPRCPRVFARQSRWLTIAEWRARGVQMLSGRVPAANELATLIEPDGVGRTAYLLTTNYRAILDYNCSNFYALSVGILGDAILP